MHVRLRQWAKEVALDPQESLHRWRMTFLCFTVQIPRMKILSDQRKSKASFSSLSYLNQVKGTPRGTIFHRDGFISVQSCRLEKHTEDMSLNLHKKEIDKKCKLKAACGNNVVIRNSVSDDYNNKGIWTHNVFQSHTKWAEISSNLLTPNLPKSSRLCPQKVSPFKHQLLPLTWESTEQTLGLEKKIPNT